MDDAHDTTLTGRLLRWGGLAATIGALLVATGTVLGTALYSGQDLPQIAGETGYFIATGLGFLGGIPLIFGLISLYRAQSEEAGAWGVVGFIGAMLGTLLFTASLWTQAMVVPSLEAHSPRFLEAITGGEVTGPLSVALILPLVFELLGYLLFGIATFRAHVFSRVTGVALIVGALVIAVPLGGITFAPLMLVLAWMGYRVFTGQVRPAPRVRTGRTQPSSTERTLETTGRR